MVGNLGENLVFLLSMPRSGSTMLNAILGGHKEIGTVPEPWFLLHLYQLKNSEKDKEFLFGEREMVKDYDAFFEKGTFNIACRLHAGFLYNKLLRRTGGAIFLDKSPNYHYVLEFIDELFPNAKKIFLIRNPLSIAASYKDYFQCSIKKSLYADTDSHDYPKAVAWFAGIFRYKSYFESDNSNLYRVRYEDIISNSTLELQGLCDFMDIPYMENMSEYGKNEELLRTFKYAERSDKNIFMHGKPHLESISKWKKDLTKDEIYTVCSLLGRRFFEEMGYGEEFEEAEKICGKRLMDDPDVTFIEGKLKELNRSFGLDLDINYHCGDVYANSPELLKTDLLDITLTQQSVDTLLFKNDQAVNKTETLLETIRLLERKVNDLEWKVNILREIRDSIPYGRDFAWRIKKWLKK